MRRSTSVALLSASVVLLVNAVTALAGVITYTDKTAWENALGGQFLTEDFNDEKLNDGVSRFSSESGHINPTFGYYQDVLTSQSGNEPYTIWSFSPQIMAYGGNWTLGGPGGSGNSLLVYVADSSNYVGAIGNGYGGEFWGFISDTPFTSVKLIGGTGEHQQTYHLDDMVYSSVPEPGTFFVLSGGLIGILLVIRRHRITS